MKADAERNLTVGGPALAGRFDSHTLPATAVVRSALVNSFRALVRLWRRPAPWEHDVQLASLPLPATM